MPKSVLSVRVDKDQGLWSGILFFTSIVLLVHNVVTSK